MFYLAQAFLLGDGLSYSSHAGVISAFGRKFARPLRLPQQLHRYLIDAAQVRTEGDYSTKRRLTPEQALEQISNATEFLIVAQQQLA